jgi:hypothetical protein
MGKVRKIDRVPGDGRRNYYLVDASFLANRYIPPDAAPAGHQRARIQACTNWWAEIDKQLDACTARV